MRLPFGGLPICAGGAGWSRCRGWRTPGRGGGSRHRSGSGGRGRAALRQSRVALRRRAVVWTRHARRSCRRARRVRGHGPAVRCRRLAVAGGWLVSGRPAERFRPRRWWIAGGGAGRGLAEDGRHDKRRAAVRGGLRGWSVRGGLVGAGTRVGWETVVTGRLGWAARRGLGRRLAGVMALGRHTRLLHRGRARCRPAVAAAPKRHGR